LERYNKNTCIDYRGEKMKITRGGIYILKDDYVENNDLLKSKRPIVVLNSEERDTFVSAVRMGFFKSITDDAHNLFIELRIKGNRYFSTILCDKVLEFSKISIKEEIGVLDEATLKIIENKLFKKDNDNVNYIIYDDSKPNEVDTSKDLSNNADMEESKEERNISEQEIVQADVVVKDMAEFEKVIFNTNEMVEFLKEKELKKEKEARRQRKYKWIWVIISNITSFILGILASYTANHWDNRISAMFEKVKNLFIELF